MKKLFKLGVIGFIVFGVPFAQAAQVCQRSDIQCYESGPSGNLATPFRIDAAGNLTTLGNETVSGTGINSNAGSQSIAGRTIYVPLGVTVSTAAPIGITATYENIISTGGNIVLAGGSGNSLGVYPAISTSTAVNGQELILGTTVQTSNFAVTLTSGTAEALDLGAATRLIQYGKRLGLIFDSTNAIWVEMFYGNN